MLRIRSKQPIDQPIDARGWTPCAMPDALSAAKAPLQVGTETVSAGDLFAIDQQPSDDQHWQLDGDFGEVHHLGSGMQAGRLTISGNVGRHAGAGMQAGTMVVQGSAGDFLGAAMRGGFIDVHGNSGHDAGGAYPGENFGQRGGQIVVRGSAGDRAGHAMRRGQLFVLGNCGDFAGWRMRAGTLLVLGTCGQHPGVEMLRGTLCLLGEERPKLPVTFRRACRYAPVALALVLKELSRLVGHAPTRTAPAEVDLYNGDLLRGGRGEILVRAIESTES